MMINDLKALVQLVVVVYDDILQNFYELYLISDKNASYGVWFSLTHLLSYDVVSEINLRVFPSCNKVTIQILTVSISIVVPPVKI